jgi:ATP-dependent Clp protease ATP-binding subunit ClpA
LGARNIRSQIELLIEEPLTDEFLKDKIQENSVITFDVDEGQLVHKTKVKK